ncbi:MAG: acyl carrier protein [Cyclobacteriaceae bacterium]
MTSTVTTEELVSFLTNQVSKLAGIEQSKITKNSQLQTFNLDSIHTMQLVVEIEERYGIELNPLLFWESPDLDSLSKEIQTQILARSK